jgi:D-arabinose 1-dehydrogenase-like Zn-dependent alcohol dehydrogenase
MRSIGYIAKSRLRVMTETIPLDDVANADERVDNGNVRFPAVVTMS